MVVQNENVLQSKSERTKQLNDKKKLNLGKFNKKKKKFKFKLNNVFVPKRFFFFGEYFTLEFNSVVSGRSWIS